jgi:hypothetical protein
MSIIPFPTEIDKTILTAVGADRRLERYLQALKLCLERNIGIQGLVAWWRENRDTLVTKDPEVDLALFLADVDVVTRSRSTTPVQQTVQPSAPTEESPGSDSPRTDLGTAYDAGVAWGKAMGEAHRAHEEWSKRNPRYSAFQCAYSVYEIFETVYGQKTNPLEVISDFFRQYIGDEYHHDTDSPSSLKEDSNRRDDNNRIAVFVEDETYQHLVDLAEWACGDRGASHFGIFSWRLSLQFFDAPREIWDTILSTNHAQFELVISRDVPSESIAMFSRILRLPMAIRPDPYGPPHLSPKFSFLGELLLEWHGPGFWTSTKEEKAYLIESWRIFFKNCTQLRVKYNNGRLFCPHDGNLYGWALESLGLDCGWGEHVAYSLNCFDPDLFCVLAHECQMFNMPFGDDNFPMEKRIKAFSDRILPLVRRLYEEKFYKVSCNLLGFFIVVSAVASEGDLDSIRELSDVVKDHLGLPGEENLFIALAKACELARGAGKVITLERLRQFLFRPDEKIDALIDEGESDSLEFKQTLRVNVHTGKPDKNIEHSALKTVAAFVNTRGGTLLIGVSDDGKVCGIEKDGFRDDDKYALHFKNLVQQTMKKALDFLDARVTRYGEVTVFVVECKRSDVPVYLENRATRSREFYVRHGPSTDGLAIDEAVEYIQREFPKRN